MSASLVIEHRCPQCGAPVALQETDRILACRYCRVRLYLVPSGFFRYCFLPPQSGAAAVFFAPYLRLRGMEFVCTDSGVRGRVVDITRNAAACSGLPDCLGLRPQAMKLHFMDAKFGRRLPARTLGLEQASTTDTQAPAVWLRRYIGETRSVIYAPFSVRDGVLCDAVLDRACAGAPAPEAFDDQADAPISFLPTLCPQCGWQMAGEKESCVLICATCNTAWRPARGRFQKIDSTLLMPDGQAADLYIPFWRIKAALTGIVLATYADLVRYGNLPKAIMPAWEAQEIFFWAPAFKIQPGMFLRIARHMTLAQPTGSAAAAFARSALYPVTLPAEEAAESIAVVLADIAKRRDRAYPLLAAAEVHVAGYHLVYVPFARSAGDFVHQRLGFGIDAAALKFGGSI